MRFAGPDAVLFIVGLLIFGGASAAIVTSPGGLEALTGDSASALGVYDVSYATSVIEGNVSDVADFSSASASFDVANEDVSKVIVVIACGAQADVGPGAWQLTVTVAGPNGISPDPTTVPCAAGEIPIEVTRVPAPTIVQGGTPEEARANVPKDANATKAIGKWTVTVTGQRGSVPLGLPGDLASGSVGLNVEKWAPTLTPVQK